MTDARALHLEGIRELLDALPDVAADARMGDNPWSFIDNPTVRPAGSGLPGRLDQPRILEAAARIDAALDALPTGRALGEAIAAARTPRDLRRVADVMAAPLLPLPVVDAARSRVWRDDAGQAISTLALLLSNARSELKGVDPSFVDLPIADLHSEAVNADVAGVLARRRRRKAVLETLSEVVPSDQRPRQADLTEYTRRLLSFVERIGALRLAFRRITGLEPADDWNPLEERDAGRLHLVMEWAEWLSEVIDPAAPLGSVEFHTALRAAYVESTGLDSEPDALLVEAQESFDALAALIGVSGAALARRVTGGADDASGSSPTGLVAGWRSPPRDPRGSGALLLRCWLVLLDHLEPLRSQGLSALRTEVLTGRLDPERARVDWESGAGAQAGSRAT